MNTLSFLLYLIHVVPTAATLSLALGIVCLLLGGVYKAMSYENYGKTREGRWSEEDPKKYKNLYEQYTSVSKKLLTTGIVCIALVILLPKEKTMYLIAASEIGEEVISMPETQEIYNDIRAVLKSYIKENN